MRMGFDRLRARRLSLLLCGAALLAGCGRAAAAQSAEWFPDLAPESLAAQLQPAAVPAVAGLSLERSVQRLEVPAAGAGATAACPVVVIESHARRADASPRMGEAPAAEWVFRVASAQDSGYARLQHRDETWYESTFWQGGEQWLRVGRDWHHPGDRGPSVRRFLVPDDGAVRVTGRVRKAHLAGDGVRVAILHNDQRVWQHELAGDDGTGVDPDLALTVKRGDTIRFVVDKRGSISCDTTYWDPVIIAADGRKFQASAAFAAAQQGAGNWYYEAPADGPDAPGMPRLAWFDAAWGWCESPLIAGAPVVLHSGAAQGCAVLADGRDASGIALALEAESPWRLEAELRGDGQLTVRLIVIPGEQRAGVAAGDTLRLGRVVWAPYSGTSLLGVRTLARWLASDERQLPLASLRAAARQAGVAELDYWAMIQQDWQRQDGTDPQRPETFEAAATRQLEQTRALLSHLQRLGGAPGLAEPAQRLEQLAARAVTEATDPAGWYLQLRRLKREIILANPLLDFDQLLFCKRVPTSYSHLVMQYYGWRARPGGGLFVLDEPGRSLRCRDILDGRLQTGNVLEPRLSYDGRRIVFSYVDCPSGPLSPQEVANDQDASRHYYHLWEVHVDGTGLRQLTDGPYDDLMPCYLPDGGVAFMSTRRKGYARCFGGQFSNRWDVYTLHRMQSDGTSIRTLSYHDTNEWFPAVSHTGHILYARWDYIDRDAVTHQNLWASRPDGTNPVAVWGNATASPHCTFQAQPIPGSQKILFTASAHHSITGGSIAMLDPTVAADGLEAIERITPEIPFPEAESRDIRQYYAAPWPLSEDFYLVAYSPYALEWEPRANRRDALGIYLLDRWNNRELIYRDPEIGSTNPCPLRPRKCPPVLPGTVCETAPPMGEMVISDVTQGLGGVPRDHIRQLRIVQIFPKTTPIADAPPIGAAREENGRAVLGTVPVEPDGSARFLVPAGKLLLLQALDADGNAYQTMRSVTYLQPGERVACVGCHEPKMTAPLRTTSQLLALQRPASELDPGPWGGRPFSYAEVVQPVLDQHCVRCHGGEKTEADLVLTGEAEGHFSRSYHALMQDANAFWGGGTNPANAQKYLVPRFGGRNPIERTPPGGLYGARGSRLMQLLREGHQDVQLQDDELRRLALWIDLNAIFYGVNLPEEQSRMRRGELVGMPEIQ